MDQLAELANSPLAGLIFALLIMLVVGFVRLANVLSSSTNETSKTLERHIGRVEGQYNAVEKRADRLFEDLINQKNRVVELANQLDDALRDRDAARTSAIEWQRLFETEKENNMRLLKQLNELETLVQRVTKRVKHLESILTERGIELPLEEPVAATVIVVKDK